MMVGVIRLRLDLSYRGTDFSGWATQPGLRTVQGTLEDALARVLRLPSVRLTVAGRTDASIAGQYRSCHCSSVIEPFGFRPAMTFASSRLASASVRNMRDRSAAPPPTLGPTTRI